MLTNNSCYHHLSIAVTSGTHIIKLKFVNLKMFQHQAAHFVLNKPWNRHHHDSITEHCPGIYRFQGSTSSIGFRVLQVLGSRVLQVIWFYRFLGFTGSSVPQVQCFYTTNLHVGFIIRGQ